MDQTSQTIFIVFTAVVTVSVLIQAVVLLSMAIGARKAQRKVQSLVDDMRLHALPLIVSSRGLIEDLSPKIKQISSNLVETTATLRKRSEEIGTTAEDLASRTRTQALRVESMVSGTLDQVAFASDAIQHGIAVPVRQMNGILNGIRAGMDVLLSRTPRNHSERDNELFV